MKKAIVIIPVYKERVDDFELISLEQCFKILYKHSICFVTHKDLDFSFYKSISERYNTNIDIEFFDKNYFTNIAGYNKLMLSSEFYKRFLNYKFMLIYQLDCFVFSDMLDYWCDADYDYIGAPWVVEFRYKKGNLNFRIRQKITQLYRKYTHKELTWEDLYNKVGNGGFSLRKIRKFYFYASKYKNSKKINRYVEPLNPLYNEDVFWSYEIPLLCNYRKPTVEKALSFSFEMQLEYSYKLTNSTLPFGCHAWKKYGLDFWRPFISSYGYTI